MNASGLCRFCMQTYNREFFDGINEGLHFSVELQQNIMFACLLPVGLPVKCGSADQRICGSSKMRMVTPDFFSADLMGKMRMRIFSRPLQTAVSSLCALCQFLPLSFVDADDYDDF